ncbi:bifunctional diguanylate cyclase/phosphodiesterase [Halalkalibacterium ligniniphilum]|uniref:bifunctional diguanylate cyclase/phosphodiesterase n=1 Tax=Halalkalibacterium ligniniphilum TaxID=1134413 RepID=UPI00034BA78C|nr:GGDEF domain-containing protein [Halalkalibacterium ligniniphilum]
MYFHPRDRFYYKTLSETADHILQIMSEYIGVNTLFITLNDRKDTFFVKVFNRKYELLKEGAAVPYSSALCRFAVEDEHASFVVSDLSDHPLTKDHSVTLGMNGNGCILAIPLTYPHGEVIGTICAFDNQPYQFSDSQVRMVELFAKLIAQTIFLDSLTIRDELTGLYNRNFVNAFLEHHMQEKDTKLAILYLDLNRFKFINDTYGHVTGDELLKLTGDRLKNFIGEQGIVCRMGGDEFLIIVPIVEDDLIQQQIEQVAFEIEQVISTPAFVEEQEFHLSASMGISLYPDHGTDMTSLFKSADTAMYRAKKLDICLAWYEENHGSEMTRRSIIESGLRKAIEREELIVYYQQQYDLKTEQLMGMEALLRWKHPTLGWIAPSEFIPVAEETGLIVPIGKWVLEEVCKRANQWMANGHDPVCFSVNISLKQISSTGFVETVEQMLRESGINPQHLMLEMTETIFMQDMERGMNVIQQLKSLGVQIAIDDFGTGYSSLGYLSQLPIDSLKIDRSFIKEIKHNQGHRAIVKAIITLAKELGIKVVAEGIEEKAQIEYLNEIGCQIGQGFYYHMPAPFEMVS